MSLYSLHVCYVTILLTQQKFIVSQFWRLEIQDQGVGRVISLRESQDARACSTRLFLVCRQLLSPAFSHGLFSVCLCVQIPSSYKNTCHVGLGLTLMTLYYFSCLILWTGCLCPPPQFICSNVISDVVVFGDRAFGRWLGHKVSIWIMAVSALIRRGRPDTASSLSATWGYNKKVTYLNKAAWYGSQRIVQPCKL